MKWQNNLPPTWLRAAVVMATGYFLIATSDVATSWPENNPKLTCIDGISAPNATLTLGALNTATTGRLGMVSCNGYDGLLSGVSLKLGFTNVGDADNCPQYSLKIEQLPPELSGAVLSSNEASGGFSVTMDFDRPDEVGCHFQIRFTLDSDAKTTTDNTGLNRLDITSAPLHVDRSISFPQVQFCNGALGGQVRGQINCEDMWDATLVEQ